MPDRPWCEFQAAFRGLGVVWIGLLEDFLLNPIRDLLAQLLVAVDLLGTAQDGGMSSRESQSRSALEGSTEPMGICWLMTVGRVRGSHR